MTKKEIDEYIDNCMPYDLISLWIIQRRGWGLVDAIKFMEYSKNKKGSTYIPIYYGERNGKAIRD